MAYDEYLADRIRRQFKEKQIHFSEMKMMGGLLFKVDNKMLCGIHIDKKYGDSLLMARIREDAMKQPLKVNIVYQWTLQSAQCVVIFS